MRAEELRKLLDRRPFEPLCLHISSGQQVDVTHPEAAILTRSLVAVSVGGSAGVGDYLIHYNLLHIVKTEPVNGQRPKRARGARKR
jgi:hypothetical protein